MKYSVIALALFVCFTTVSVAQKYAYVDTEYILENIPEYKDAQNQLDEYAAEYQQEVEEKIDEINKMIQDFQAEAVLMPEDVKNKKEEEINKKKEELATFQNQRFGKDGDLFLKREELVKPIQEKIFNAIEEIAVDKNYSFVFDKAGSLSILYVNAKYDISDDVLDKVGAELGTVRKEDRVKKNTPTSNPSRSSSKPGGNAPGPVRKGGKK